MHYTECANSELCSCPGSVYTRGIVLPPCASDPRKALLTGRYRKVFYLTNPLIARVVGAPQMISQPVPSIFPCSPQPSGTWRTPGLSIPWCCLPTSFSVCLGLYPLPLCLVRWFWPDLMNGWHVHTTAGCSFLCWGSLCRYAWALATANAFRMASQLVTFQLTNWRQTDGFVLYWPTTT